MVLRTPQPRDVPKRAVNVPAAAVVPPIAPGAANVAPPSVAALTLVSDAPLIAGRFPSSFVASIEVAAEIVPGAMNVLGMERAGVVVPVPTVIWFAVPVTLVTVPEPLPPPLKLAVTAWLGFSVAVADPDVYVEHLILSQTAPPGVICQLPAAVALVTLDPPAIGKAWIAFQVVLSIVASNCSVPENVP